MKELGERWGSSHESNTDDVAASHAWLNHRAELTAIFTINVTLARSVPKFWQLILAAEFARASLNRQKHNNTSYIWRVMNNNTLAKKRTRQRWRVELHSPSVINLAAVYTWGSSKRYYERKICKVPSFFPLLRMSDRRSKNTSYILSTPFIHTIFFPRLITTINKRFLPTEKSRTSKNTRLKDLFKKKNTVNRLDRKAWYVMSGL